MAGGMTVGPYRVGRRLGLGGMGEVFLATRSDEPAPQPVALKLLLPHLAEDPAAVRMFLNEARVVARMSHGNVVHILDVGAGDGRYYLAMELVRGVALSAFIRALAEARVLLPPELVLYVTRALCDGLHHAHEQRGERGEDLQIVHRDVSPENVLVSDEGGVKLNDFGIAKARYSFPQTRPGHIRGKCEYLAPEQARGEEVDRRADLFGVAVTVAHLATLASPFRREPEVASLLAIEREPFPDLSASRPDLHPKLVAALARAAQKDPAARFPTALALRDALPEPPPGCAQALGELVRQVCRVAVERISAPESDARELPWTSSRSMPSFAPAPVTAPHTAEREGEARTLAHTLLGNLPPLTEAAPLAPKTRGTQDMPTAVRPPARSLPERVVVLLAQAAMLLSVGVAGPAPLPDEPPLAAQPVAVAVVDPEAAPAPAAQPAPEPGAAEPVPAPAEAESQTALLLPRVITTRTVAPLKKHKAPSSPSLPKGKNGLLSLDALPWAEVFLDGRRIGETPLGPLTLPPGEVRVLLRSPTTNRQVVRTVTVRSGRESFIREDLQ